MSKEGISRLLKLVRTEMTPIDSGTDEQLKLVPRDSGLQSKRDSIGPIVPQALYDAREPKGP